MIPPGSTLGILGGGQLGRMLGLTARRMGYKVHVFEPKPNSPAGMIADREVNARFDDEAALIDFAQQVDRVTLEFENIPSTTLDCLAKAVTVYPGKHVLETCQNRWREKQFLQEHSFPCAPFTLVDARLVLFVCDLWHLLQQNQFHRSNAG